MTELKLLNIPVTNVRPSPKQVRTEFDLVALNELAASIKEQGVQVPIRVRCVPEEGGCYQLIAGERRLRAAKIAGLELVPALVGDVEDKQLFELGIIENIQRENLGPIEEALGLQAFVDECQDIEHVCRKTSKSRGYVDGRIALLTLPLDTRELISRRELTLGCAEVLIELENHDDVMKFAHLAVRLGLTPAKLRARIQHLPKKKGEKKDAGKKRRVSTKQASKVLIECYTFFENVEVSSLPAKDRQQLAQQANVLQEELASFIGALTSENDETSELASM